MLLAPNMAGGLASWGAWVTVITLPTMSDFGTKTMIVVLTLVRLPRCSIFS